MPRLLAPFLLIPALACHDSTGPADSDVRLEVAAGADQFVQPNANLEQSLTVRVTAANGGAPVEGTVLQWEVVSGPDATVLSATASDVIGMAFAGIRAGTDTGTVTIEARASRLVGPPATFEVRIIRPPVLTAVTPATATAGADITITGSRFRDAADMAVLVGGLRAPVRNATATTITAEVPRCVLDRNTDVRVAIGPVTSNALPVHTTAGTATPIALARGESVRLAAGADLACIDLSAAPAGAEYLVVAQDVSRVRGLPLRYELRGIVGGSATALPAPVRPVPAEDIASRWELGLRQRERAFGPPLAPAADVKVQSMAAPPQVGDTREFEVLESDQKSTRTIRATIRAISERAILYVDDTAPAGGFSTTDLQSFGDLFDDPIYATEIDTFGSPSDIDRNGHIIILFTPAVNALTPRGETGGFVAGYFYGCDLLTADRCKATNRGEIFYSMVPDPTAQFGDARAKTTVLGTVPAVLAHEFQHMISFARRNGSLNVVWLSEGLAHAAEDVVGEVFAARGDALRAGDFLQPNRVRAQRYLRAIESTSRIDLESPGTLEMRGGAWLFVKYLAGQYGGAMMLERLTGSSLDGAASVEAAAGRPWEVISSEFAVALWADGAPELFAVPLDPRLTIPDLDLRAELGTGFPVLAQAVAFQDFLLSGTLASAAQAYLIVRAPAGGVPFRLAYSGPRGEALPAGSAALSLLRLK